MGGDTINKEQKEVQQAFLDSEKEVLERLKKNYQDALNDINKKIEQLLARQDADMQHVIYQVEYQKALKKQVQSILEQLQANEFETVSEYLTQSYTNGYIGTMYDIAGQGIPLILPIDQEQVVAALQNETNLSTTLYDAFDIKDLQKKISGEISRGISTGMMYSDIARNISNYANISRNNAMRIARTEGHRIQCKAASDAQWKAKSRGADIVKQWDATLDGKTRASHKKVDGEIRELGERRKDEEPFSNGLMFPGDPRGDASEVINCRCALLQRARWALDEEELETLKKRAEYFGLGNTKNFIEYKEKFLRVQKVVVDTENAQNYKAVQINKEDKINTQRDKVEVNAYKLINTNNNIYVSDRVALKPKQIHTIDVNTTKALKKLGINNLDNLPKTMIINSMEMQTGAVASYNPILNILYLDENAGIASKIKALQEGFACPDDQLSTLIHEYIHWQDSEEYSKLFGAIKNKDDYNKYIKWCDNKAKKELDKLVKNGYNIFSISNYATHTYQKGAYNETYTEYKVKELLKGN